MKVIMIAPNTKTFINFRLDLIKEIIKKGHKVVAVIPEEDEKNILKNEGVDTIRVDLDKNSKSIFKNLKYYFDLKKIIKRENPDIVFSYTIKPIIFGSLAAKKAKVKNIYSMLSGLGYIYTNNDFKTKIIRAICSILYKKSLKYNKKVIFQNIDDKNEFIKRKYLNASKCEVVDGSGVNLDKYKRIKLPKENTFLMISRGIIQKGVREYFLAARLVKSKYPNSKFIYIQSDDKTPITLKYKFIKKFIDNEIIEYHKDVDNVLDYYKQAKIFVLPSYYGEGIPRVLLESLSCGLPIITTNNVGCKEVINNEKNGFLVPIQDYQELAEKIIYIIENPKIIEKMSDESYKYCKQRFDVKIINKKMLQILEIK